ncbi:MAG: isoleucine--tRNA ligase [Pseudomonadota bacterium]
MPAETFPKLLPTVELEADVLAFWKRERSFERGQEIAAGRPRYTFYEGPPTANGTPHNGHVLTRVIKDLVPRYFAMRGYHVPRKGGWDTHGLPVEVEVEKVLDIHGKEAIEAYGLERFNRRCRESVFAYVKEWELLTERIGFWVDLGEAYVTFHRSYVESVWWALSRLFQKGLLYQGHKVVWWWPQGGTALSAAEVGLGYKTVKDPSITIRFRVRGQPGLSLLAWTTTPWTLPSNVALAVKPNARYAYVKVGEETLIVAEALVGHPDLKEALGGGEVIETVDAVALVGMAYEPLYSFQAPEGGKAYEVIFADYVTMDTGTGVVHQAPAFGAEDYETGQANGLGFLCLVGPDGRFVPGTGFLEGRFCKDCDTDIIRDLHRRGLLATANKVEHEYPFCWRVDSDPLIQYARPAWFIRTTALNAEALANNAAVRWLPEHIQEGRFGDFLRNNVDWALSRERFWGTPLNIWICPGCEHQVAPASAAEILAMNPDAFDPSVEPDLQVHRPWIDRVTLPCPQCGATMRRVPEVIDCWFDAGSMPFAQHGFPHQGREEFAASFPADFISEAVDQTRGWFYALLMISTLLFDDESCRELGLEPRPFPHPYRNCIVLGHVCDPEGRKESKSKGNYVPPDLVILGRTKLHVQADERLQPGQLGMMATQVASLDLQPGATIAISATEDGERRHLQVVTAAVTVKETVHLHPEDMAALGLERDVWLHAPFEPPGADAFRWLFCSASPVWSNTRLSLRAVRDGQREFLIRLRNVHQFFAIYGDIAGFSPGDSGARALPDRCALDRWVLHERNQLVRVVTERMDALLIYDAARAIHDFVDALSNWYVRRSRGRFWGEGQETSDALATLYEVLVTLAKVIAPFVPFTAEALYRSLVLAPGLLLAKVRAPGADFARSRSRAVGARANRARGSVGGSAPQRASDAGGGSLPPQTRGSAGRCDHFGLRAEPRAVVEAPESVHHCAFPSPDSACDAPELAEDMALLRELASLGLAARAQVKVRVRQPLAAAEVVLADPARATRLAALLPLLSDELNVRAVHFSDDPERFVTFRVKPNFKALGRRLGKDMKACAQALAAMPGAQVRRRVMAGGFELELPGGVVTLTADDVLVEVEAKGGFQAASSAVALVALQSDLDDDLREEGLAREVVNRIQGLRKEMDLGYTDRIHVGLGGDPALLAAVRRFWDYVSHETLALALLDAPADASVLDVDGMLLKLWAERA